MIQMGIQLGLARALERLGILLPGKVMYIGGSDTLPPPLSKDEEAELIGKLAGEEGDEVRTKLIEHNLRLVAHIVKKYANSGVDTDDLISIGSIGLIKAVHTFKPEAGKLTAYASRCIENEILMCMRANRKNRGVVLMGESIGTDKDGNELTLADLLGTEPDMVAKEVETVIEAGRAIRLMDSVLDAREIEVLRMRYGLIDGEPRPQHAVAAALGISRSYVSRIEKKALEKLRDALERSGG